MNLPSKVSIRPKDIARLSKMEDMRFSKDFGMDIRPSIMNHFDQMAGQMGQELDENTW